MFGISKVKINKYAMKWRLHNTYSVLSEWWKQLWCQLLRECHYLNNFVHRYNQACMPKSDRLLTRQAEEIFITCLRENKQKVIRWHSYITCSYGVHKSLASDIISLAPAFVTYWHLERVRLNWWWSRLITWDIPATTSNLFSETVLVGRVNRIELTIF